MGREVSSRSNLSKFGNFESYFDKYSQDFQVPMEGSICIVTVFLGWDKELLDKQVKIVQQISRRLNLR